VIYRETSYEVVSGVRELVEFGWKHANRSPEYVTIYSPKLCFLLRSEVIPAENMLIVVFCVVTPCALANSYQSFSGM
jgi:hypothetical protein